MWKETYHTYWDLAPFTWQAVNWWRTRGSKRDERYIKRKWGKYRKRQTEKKTREKTMQKINRKRKKGLISTVICQWYALKPVAEASVSWAITKHVRIIIRLKIWLGSHHGVPCCLLSWGIHCSLFTLFSLAFKCRLSLCRLERCQEINSLVS